MFNRNKVSVNSKADMMYALTCLQNQFSKRSVFIVCLNVCKMADKEFAQKKILVTGVGGGKLIFVHIDDS